MKLLHTFKRKRLYFRRSYYKVRQRWLMTRERIDQEFKDWAGLRNYLLITLSCCNNPHPLRTETNTHIHTPILTPNILWLRFKCKKKNTPLFFFPACPSPTLSIMLRSPYLTFGIAHLFCGVSKGFNCDWIVLTGAPAINCPFYCAKEISFIFLSCISNLIQCNSLRCSHPSYS